MLAAPLGSSTPPRALSAAYLQPTHARTHAGIDEERHAIPCYEVYHHNVMAGTAIHTHDDTAQVEQKVC